ASARSSANGQEQCVGGNPGGNPHRAPRYHDATSRVCETDVDEWFEFGASLAYISLRPTCSRRECAPLDSRTRGCLAAGPVRDRSRAFVRGWVEPARYSTRTRLHREATERLRRQRLALHGWRLAERSLLDADPDHEVECGQAHAGLAHPPR